MELHIENETYRLRKGEVKQVFVNVAYFSKGTISYKIETPDGQNACKMWWTLGPFGKNKSLGTLQNTGKLQPKGYFWRKLKVQALQDNTVIEIKVRIEYVPFQVSFSKRFYIFFLLIFNIF